jgi:hypothetical protein
MKRLLLSILLAIVFTHVASIAYFYAYVWLQGFGRTPASWDAGQVFAMLVLPLWLFQDKVWLVYLGAAVVIWVAWTMTDKARRRRAG